jgi:hypothetical protein
MTLRDLIKKAARLHIELDPIDCWFSVSADEILQQLEPLLEGSDPWHVPALDDEFVGDSMVYDWFSVEHDCAEGTGLYFQFKINPTFGERLISSKKVQPDKIVPMCPYV